ncbi:MAG: M23 family metallopeptidase [Alphaproteobacteria bacterium]|nr:M23 family metallopeptidase [Alphaproteobacteria bacterium]
MNEGRRGLRGVIARLLPERQILVRTNGRHALLTLSTRRQVAFFAVLLVFLGWNALATLAWLKREDTLAEMRGEVAEREHEIDGLKASYRSAFGRLDHVQRLFGDIGNEITNIQGNLLALAERQMGANRSTPRAGPTPPHRTETAALTDRMAHVEETLSWLRSSHNEFLRHATDLAQGRVGEIEKALAGVGIDGDALLADGAKPFGQGGPFFNLDSKSGEPAWASTLASLNLGYERLDSLTQVMRAPPLGTPLAEYDVSSAYGVRNDPINNLTGVHEGIDLLAPMNTPVHATGAGLVTFAGWRARYGRLVEVDHGMGITTRYAHLARINVAVGERVDRRSVIGLLGNSGRSTGPHLHYEVRVAGEPRNPLKFILAGKNVLQGQ